MAHDAPCLTPEMLHNCCFQFLLGIAVVSGEIEEKGLCNILRAKQVGLCENGE